MNKAFMYYCGLTAEPLLVTGCRRKAPLCLTNDNAGIRHSEHFLNVTKVVHRGQVTTCGGVQCCP
jgi:hypothetical protein